MAAELHLGLRGLEESLSMSMPAEFSMPTTEATTKDEEEEGEDRTIVEAEASSVSSELLLTSDSNNTEDETQVTITNNAGGSNTNNQGDPNHPCNSNDGEQWNLLTQAMFGGEGGITTNQETGELIDNDIFIVDNKPCPNPLEGVGEEEEEVEETDEPPDVPTTGTPTPMPSTASPTPNPIVDDLVDTVTDTTESGENNDGDAEDGGDESTSATKSYYSCSTDTVSTSNSSDDATKLIISYNYELHTTSPFSEDTLLNFENNMAQDLADKYGLITCDERKKKRNLRGLQSSDEEQGGEDTAKVQH